MKTLSRVISIILKKTFERSTRILKIETHNDMPKESWYAVANGRNRGIFPTWNECKSQVDGYSGGVYKKFSTPSEAASFIQQNPGSSGSNNSSSGSGSSSNSQRNNITKKSLSTKCKRTYSTNSSDDEFVAKKSKICSDNDSYDKEAGYVFNKDKNGYVEVYTDGACSNNGRKNPQAGIGVWFGTNHPLNISKPVIGRATNNMAEIQAVTIAILTAKKAGISKLKINTDSKFLISCITQWMPKWKRNGWKTANNQSVINKTELIEMENALSSMQVVWNHVKGHNGIEGNVAADELARAGCLKYKQ